MKTFLLLSIFIASLLYSNGSFDVCDTDIKAMTKHNNAGEKALYENRYTQAKSEYVKSVYFSNRALLSCQELPNYDFNLMYNYIVHSENEINKINNIQASVN